MEPVDIVKTKEVQQLGTDIGNKLTNGNDWRAKNEVR